MSKSKYNVFIVNSENIEETVDALNELRSRNPDFNPLMKPHQYMHKCHKNYLKRYLDNKQSILRFDMLKNELLLNDPTKKVSNEVLSAYLKHKGFNKFFVKTCEGNHKLVFWKHAENNIC